MKDRYDTVREKIEANTLLHKTAFPEDIATTIVHLIVDGTMTTGQILVLDGGHLISQGKL
jgi:hypothetical protein